MRILHTSDWHLGKIIYGQSLIEDQRYFINDFLFPLIDEYLPDAIILSGDIFDRQIAPVEAIRLFDSFVTRLIKEHNTRLIAVTGNHDGADRLGIGMQLLRSSEVYITSRLEGDFAPVVLEGKRPIHIYSLPYLDPPAVRDYLGSDEIKSFEDAYKAVLNIMAEKIDKKAYNILVAHLFVAGSVTSDSESSLFVGGSGEVSPGVFKEFDYVALGHLHRAQNHSNICYSGSPLKYSFDEENHKKSVTLLDFGESPEPVITQIPVKPLRDMRVVRGSIEEIVKKAETDKNKDDYIFARLEGPLVFEPMAKLRKVYPNILGITQTGLTGGEYSLDRSALKEKFHQNNYLSIFEEFIKQICFDKATESDVALFNQALEELAREDPQ
ncbi:MAG TPA: exonuclease SbcCD subunit D [Clostridiales bacterium]|nr:exonuclease SbcCD subunit D [Clostridiales bacterium]